MHTHPPTCLLACPPAAAGQGVQSEFERLIAWLLWLRQDAPAGPWRDYIQLLPKASSH